MKKIVLITALMFFASAGLINAQVAARQVEQQSRIKQGVESKELTKPEAAKLKREQKKIRKDKKIAKADGKVTLREKRSLKHEQKHASRDIRKQKHDRQKRVK